MPQTREKSLTYQAVELAGVRYAILPETALCDFCRKAGANARLIGDPPAAESIPDDVVMDQASLARRLVSRRERAALTQAELARRAGVRVETLNRIERGKVNPDFATVRKLVLAMEASETYGRGSARRGRRVLRGEKS